MKVGAPHYKPSLSISALVCFVLATSIWLFSSLNDRYAYHVALPLSIESREGFVWSEPPPAELELQLEATGWNLIRISVIRPTIAFTATELKASTVLDTHSLMRFIQAQLPGAAIVENVNPAFIPLQKEAIMTKKVPVVLQYQNPEGFHVSRDNFRLQPDSIAITGPVLEVKNFSSCGTKNVVLSATEGIQEGTVAVATRLDLQYSAIAVAYKVELIPMDSVP